MALDRRVYISIFAEREEQQKWIIFKNIRKYQTETEIAEQTVTVTTVNQADKNKSEK